MSRHFANIKSKSEFPFVSIIVPVYNVEKYVEKCLKSISLQTYEKIEVLVIDDGSKDNSGKICEDFAKNDDRITVYHKENGGLSDARNYGIARAKGEYITCIDSDDFVDVDYIEYLVNLQKKYNTKMSVCQHRVKYDNGNIRDRGKQGDEVLNSFDCMEKLLYHEDVDTSAWAKLYHYSLFDKVKYPKGKIFEDIGTTYALILQCDWIAVGFESKYNYIFHKNSIVNGPFNPAKLDLIEMTDHMAENSLKMYPELSAAILRRRVYARLSTINQMLDTESYRGKRNELISFVKLHSKEILKDRRAPKRDKAAIILLKINYKLYKKTWLMYRRHIMKC